MSNIIRVSELSPNSEGLEQFGSMVEQMKQGRD